MADLEELERRKRELELRRDIARLERNDRLKRKAEEIASTASEASTKARSKLATWSWGRVWMCAIPGAVLLLGGLHDGSPILAGVGGVLLVPLVARLLQSN
jgi:hypothetical protein